MPEYIALTNDCVRIRQGTGYWELDEINGKQVKVTYQFHGETGGEIPAWLVNSFIVSHPFRTMKNLLGRLRMD